MDPSVSVGLERLAISPDALCCARFGLYSTYIVVGFIGVPLLCLLLSNRLRRFAQQSISKKEKRELEEAQATGFPFGVGGYYFYGPCP